MSIDVTLERMGGYWLELAVFLVVEAFDNQHKLAYT